MQQDIYPVRLINPMPGKSNPQLIEFSDNINYVVKFKNSRHGTRALVNEYVVAKLADILELPVVPFRIVYLPKEFMVQHEKLHRTGFAEGHQFASLYIPDGSGLSTADGQHFPTRDQIKNAADAAGIIVFDHWVHNLDRGSQNILLQSLSDGRYHVYMIDHGKCFPGGFYWTAKTLIKEPKKILKKSSNLWCASLLNSHEEMKPYIDVIQKLSEERIYEVVSEIPDDWKVSDAEKAALVTHLVKAKATLPKQIERFSRKVKTGKALINKKKRKKK